MAVRLSEDRRKLFLWNIFDAYNNRCSILDFSTAIFNLVFNLEWDLPDNYRKLSVFGITSKIRIPTDFVIIKIHLPHHLFRQ